MAAQESEIEEVYRLFDTEGDGIKIKDMITCRLKRGNWKTENKPM
jgi:hypothetical protein